MKSIFRGLAFAAVVAMAPLVQAAGIVVNVDGFANASSDGSTKPSVDILLNAGIYELSFIDGLVVDDALFTAFSRFSGQTNCNASGASCSTGWENSVRYMIDGNTFLFGDGNASGGVGPISGGGYFQTADDSFANSGQYTDTFTIAADNTTVSFFLFDGNTQLGDNRGGVSLDVAAVPLPAAAWLFASALLGLGAVKRRKASKNV